MDSGPLHYDSAPGFRKSGRFGMATGQPSRGVTSFTGAVPAGTVRGRGCGPCLRAGPRPKLHGGHQWLRAAPGRRRIPRRAAADCRSQFYWDIRRARRASQVPAEKPGRCPSWSWDLLAGTESRRRRSTLARRRGGAAYPGELPRGTPGHAGASVLGYRVRQSGRTAGLHEETHPGHEPAFAPGIVLGGADARFLGDRDQRLVPRLPFVHGLAQERQHPLLARGR